MIAQSSNILNLFIRNPPASPKSGIRLVFYLWLCCNFISLSTSNTCAQVSDSTTSNRIKLGKFVAFPLVFFLPETSWGFGAAGAYTFKWKNQAVTANPSQIQFVGTYTLEDQLILYTPFKLYFEENKYYLFGEIGFYKYFYWYYGIGPKTVKESEESFEVDFPRIEINGTKRLTKNIFAGLSYRFDDFEMQRFDPDGEIMRSITGSSGGRVSGIGFRAILDSRDHIFYPSAGWYADFSWMLYDDVLGSDYNFSSLTMLASHYISISSTKVIALNAISQYTSGTTPFYYLAFHGGSKNARGYLEGRYRDNFMYAINLACRLKIKGRFGATVFTNFGGVASKLNNSRLDEVLPAIGVGLRFTLDKTNQLNLRLDYGYGQEGGAFYITVGEAF